jgi:IS5 family transposase
VQGKSLKSSKTLALYLEEVRVYRPESKQVSVFENESFFQFQGLSSDNDWVRLAKLIPWAELERRYAQTFDSNVGNVGKPARMALGALVIKERYGFSDEDTVQEIRMNPYLQFFLGLPAFQHEAPFDASTMTLFRKRIPADLLADLNDYIIGRCNPYAEDENADDDPPDSTPPDPPTGQSDENANTQELNESEPPTNRGTLILDATCVPQDIRYPTDISLLNEARECLEDMIDSAFPKGQKPRTYRKVARRDYLRYAKNRRPSQKLLRKSLRKQLSYVARNLGYLSEVKDRLSEKDQKQLQVIEVLYAQQKQMYEQGSKRVDDRIVSLHQPWVRPIVRGKAKAAVEFGAKIAVSLVDGYPRIERLSWDNFHEGTTLQESVESYRADTGVYPERVLTDRAYRTRENLQYCKERGIRMSGPKLGRPPKDKALYRQQLLEERLESGERSAIESSFGVGKRRYSLNLVMERLQETSEVAIHVSILTMNLWKRLRALLFALFQGVLQASVWCRKLVVMSMVVVWGAEGDLKTVIVQ